MRILLATYWYLPHIGGVNTYVNVLRKELIKNGHEVDVVAHFDETNDKIYMLTNGKYIDKSRIRDIVYDRVFDYYEKNQPYVEDWIRWREIERYSFELALSLFDLEHYDIIHTQDIVSTRALARIKPDYVPLVSTIHGFLATEHVIAGDITSKKSMAWDYVISEEYHGATSAERTIVPTNWLKNLLLDRTVNVPSEQLTTIPYGMDINKFLKQFHSPTEGYIPFKNEGKTVMICPARMVPVKGHRILLEALAKLRQKRDDFVCWMVGGGELLSEMQSLSYQLNLQDHVHFLGDRKDVPQLLRQSDMLVLPSIQDNHPFTIMEAQVGEKLVVASNTGGIPEMVKNGVTGFLFQNKNSNHLAKLLDDVLSNPMLRKRVAKQGKEWGKRQWSPSTLERNTVRIYKQVLSRQYEGSVFEWAF